MSSPTIKPRRHLPWRPRNAVDKILVFIAIAAAFTLALLAYNKATAVDYAVRLSNVTQLAEQNAAALQNAGSPSIGPPAQSVASGVATPPPVEVAPTTPGVSPKVTATLTPAQEQHIANLVLAKIKVPQPTTAQLSRAVVAVLAEHPSLTLSQVITAVNTYEKKHPPKPGATGSPGLPGSVGPSGLPGLGIASITWTTDTSDPDNSTVTFTFTLTDGTTTDVGPLPLPRGATGEVGPKGSDAPVITGHKIVNNGDGTCIDTLYLSDGSTDDSNSYACSPPPTSTTVPTAPPT